MKAMRPAYEVRLAVIDSNGDREEDSKRLGTVRMPRYCHSYKRVNSKLYEQILIIFNRCPLHA